MNKAKFYKNLNIFYLVRLIARNYFKNNSAMFTDFILPSIIMGILFTTLDKEAVNLLLPGILLTPIITSSFISFSVSYNEWRNSVIIKKIRVSQISTSQLFWSFLFFYFFIGLFTFGFGVLYALILSELGLESLLNFKNTITKMNWLLGFMAVFQLILICIVCGFLVSSVFKKPASVLAAGLTLFLVQAFLLGCYLPLSLVVKQKSLRIASYFLPFYSPIRMFQHVWLDSVKPFESEIIFDNNIGEFGEYVSQFRGILQNWKILVSNGAGGFDQYPINFHPSYWSMIALSSGWFITVASLTIVINKNMKFN